MKRKSYPVLSGHESVPHATGTYARQSFRIRDRSAEVRAAVLSAGGAYVSRSPGSLALDQWRGIAIILVLISHGFFFTHRVAGAGRIGVNLFFFISGLLVFRSLASSKQLWWQIPADFWWRRLRRLYPALLAYLLLMLCVLPVLQHIPTSLGHSDFRSFVRELPAALAYYIDFATKVPPSMGHFWSLAVEVQFYLLAPLLFLLGRASRGAQSWVFGGVLALSMGYGLIAPLHSRHLEQVRYEFQVAVWPMILGFCCEAAKHRFLACPRWFVNYAGWVGVVCLPASLVVMALFTGTKLLVIGMGAFLLLPCYLAYLFGLPFRGKTGRTLAWLGERTYSIYLLQQPFTIAQYLPSLARPFGAVASAFAGSFWFDHFERPFLSPKREKQIQQTLPSVGILPAARERAHAGAECEPATAD